MGLWIINANHRAYVAKEKGYFKAGVDVDLKLPQKKLIWLGNQ